MADKKHKCIFSGYALVDEVMLSYNIVSTFIFGFRKKRRNKRKQRHKPTDIPPQTPRFRPQFRPPSRRRPSPVKTQPATVKKNRYVYSFSSQDKLKVCVVTYCMIRISCVLIFLLDSLREIKVTTMKTVTKSFYMLHCGFIILIQFI